MGTYGAWVAEYLPEAKRLRALAFWLGEEYVEHYEHDIQGTPCEKMLRYKEYFHVLENVVNLFPGDRDLSKIGAVSYIGFPLLDPLNNILGNIAVIDTYPMPSSFRNFALFKIFGARATAEILRLNAEAVLQEREEKLRGIFEGAMDAIVELDQDFRITMLNPSARNLICRQNDDIIGTTFEPLLANNDFLRLTYFVRTLKNRQRGDR